MAVDLKYGKVTVQNDSKRHPLNKSDEPVFILRAQDALAMATLARYRGQATAIEEGKVNDKFFKRLEDVEHAFTEWRIANPKLVKIPD